MKTIKLLEQLRNETFVILKSSGVHGVGVYAIQDILKGTRNIFSKNMGEWIKIPFSEVEKLPEHSRNLIETYCLYDDKHYFVPEYGFKLIDPVIFLNHSSCPNIKSIDNGEEFEAVTDIPAGAELLIDYGSLGNEMEAYE